MDVITHIKACLDRWSTGGKEECQSTLTSPHCHLSDPACSDELATAYQTLLHNISKTWNTGSGTRLEAAELASFIQSVLALLPSTSSASVERSRNLVLFGELFVDLVWTIDGELDEVILDAKSVIAHIIAEQEKAKKEKKDKVTTEAAEKAEELKWAEEMQKAEESQKTAEGDKGTLAELMKMLLEAGIVDAAVCRERLDVALISEIGLITDRSGFDRREVRTRTSLFYKQNKFNLLREQSEGYTKLTTDLIASLGPPNIAATATPVESLDAVRTRAAAVWERVVSLIGYFDLDPNRALDIILDVFSVNIATHWQFFLSLLACSPWVGGHTCLQDWNNAASMKDDTQEHPYRGKSLDEVLLHAESSVRGSRPPSKFNADCKPKPKVLAQVLGFKFNHYQSPETKATCPRGLYLAAALLIREEFISVEDLFPHLSPSEEDMPNLHKKYLDDVQDRIKSSSNNLLAMAAPLESSSMGSSSKSKTSATESKATNEVKGPPPQKAMLVVALLSVGVLRPAIALMTRYPWLIDVQRELADLLLRVLKASISPLYEKMFSKERNKGFSQPRPRYPTNSTSTVLVTPTRGSQLTLCAPPPPSTLTHDFIFFYPQWSEWVPVCETVDDVIDIVGPLLGFVGLYISRDTLFITKLMRIAKIHLKTDAESRDTTRPLPPITEPESPVQQFWLDVTRRYLLPALSMLPGNAVCTVEVWTILRAYDLSIRWRLYGEWRDQTYKSHPELNAQRILREREAKGILRRLSSQTVDNLAGTVAKMAHTNPCIFFTNAVNQIQAYDNLADVVIQALRFSTNMGFDVLVFIVIDALANPNKERVKEDGANASDWLQSLATFSGALLRRYATDSSSLLKYIVHQLYSGQTTEIIVLEKLILRMAGIEPLPSLSDTQIAAMAGGPTLRIEAVGSDLRGAGLDVTEAAFKGPQRLGKTLIDTKLAFPILAQVAQQRQACVFKAKDAYLKSIAYLFDATHGVLFQYLDLITTPSVIPLEDYRQIIPPLSELSGLYGVSPPIAMQIYRPMLNDAIAKHASEWCKAEEAAKIERAEAAEKRLKAALAAKREIPVASTEGAPAGSTPMPEAEPELNGSADLDTMEIDAPGQNTTGNTGVVTNGIVEEKVDRSPWLPELHALFDDCKQIAPGNAYDVIGPGFYLTFWQMSGYDLHYPKEKYSEIEKTLQASGETLYNKARQAERSSDKSTRASATTYRQQRERYNSTISELRKEKSAQEIVYRYTTEKNGRLDKEKAFWFSHVGAGAGKGATFIQSLIEHCIQPRCLLSPMDAVYCARLIRTLHERGTPNFHTLMCYDKLLGEHVKVVIFSCSENEARNYGRFLKGILQDLYGWHKDQKVYDASNRRKDGSEITILPGLQTQLSKDGPPTPDDLLKWPDFKSFLKKCHRKLGRCFSECIQAGDFMHVYNAVLVLKEIIEVFPVAAVNEVVGATIDHEVQKLVQNEERGDLKILARAYYSSLKKREKIWAMQKSVQPVKPALIKKASSQNLTEKSRDPSTANLPTGPRASHPSLPAAPERAPPVERPSSAAKLALESIPRPEVVKRNRDSRPPEAPPDSSKKEQPEPMQVDQQPNSQGRPQNKPPATPANLSSQPKEDIQAPQPSIPSRPSGRLVASHPTTDLRKEVLQGMNGGSRPATPLPSSQSTLSQNGSKELPQSSPRYRDQEPVPPMAPPAEPSQTVQAHELRSSRRNERRSPRESRSDVVDSPARRSLSPATRPGTRNASVDSRASGESRRDRVRHDRSFGEDSKRSTNVDIPSRAERGSGVHREVLNGRGGRDRIPGSSTRDGDRDRELDRERGRERDKDRDREREKRDRGERDSHRDRDRERDRDRGDRDKDRERHRRDERDRSDRDRKSSSNKDLEIAVEHSLPSRPDGSRHRAHTSSIHPDDIQLGKRRRGIEEEQPDPRGSAKRSSRHRTRTSDKETSPGRRDPERRRKDRDTLQSEPSSKSIGMGAEKPYDRSRGIDSSPTSAALRIDVSTPSAPRAMAAASPRMSGRGDTSPVATSAREKEQDRDRGRRDRSDRISRETLHVDRDGRVDKIDKPERSDRDERERGRRGDRADKGDREWKEGPGLGLQNGSSSLSTGSLKDRIGAMPPAPPVTSSGRGSIGESSGREDHSDRLKRTVTDREKDASHESQLTGSNTSQPLTTTKRFRIDRNRKTVRQ